MKAKTPVNTLTDRSKGDGSYAGRYKEQCRGQGTLDAFADTPKEVEQETLKHTLADVMTEAIIDSRLG